MITVREGSVLVHGINGLRGFSVKMEMGIVHRLNVGSDAHIMRSIEYGIRGHGTEHQKLVMAAYHSRWWNTKRSLDGLGRVNLINLLSKGCRSKVRMRVARAISDGDYISRIGSRAWDRIVFNDYGVCRYIAGIDEVSEIRQIRRNLLEEL